MNIEQEIKKVNNPNLTKEDIKLALESGFTSEQINQANRPTTTQSSVKVSENKALMKCEQEIDSIINKYATSYKVKFVKASKTGLPIIEEKIVKGFIEKHPTKEGFHIITTPHIFTPRKDKSKVIQAKLSNIQEVK